MSTSLKRACITRLHVISKADGYARVNGIGAFVTTFGPGELSAYCGMAGQYAEYVSRPFGVFFL